eukprot:SAG31_NODE_151_length_22216_cov_37.572139_12_plen_59_part_00
MTEKWEFGVSTTSIEEHITMLEDWLILAPPSPENCTEYMGFKCDRCGASVASVASILM